MEEYQVKVYSNRTEWRNKEGQRHRLDGPAVEWSDGDKYWYQNGQLNRPDGPAIEYASGTKFWYKNDRMHRLDGPAVEKPNGYKAWYIKGERLTEEEFNRKVNPAPCQGREVQIDGVTYILKAK